jgi:hypothetical protein
MSIPTKESTTNQPGFEPTIRMTPLNHASELVHQSYQLERVEDAVRWRENRAPPLQDAGATAIVSRISAGFWSASAPAALFPKEKRDRDWREAAESSNVRQTRLKLT